MSMGTSSFVTSTPASPATARSSAATDVGGASRSRSPRAAMFRLSEQIAELLHEGAALRHHVLLELAGELFEQLSLARGELGRHLEQHLPPLIAATAAAPRNALALETEHRGAAAVAAISGW